MTEPVLDTKHTSQASALKAAYERIERERERNCWIYIRPIEEALGELSRVVCRAPSEGALPLLGVPFAVKDNIDVAGMPTSAACPSYSYVPTRSAQCVERLIAAGAICLGKTNLDQLATGLSGARSPYGICASVANGEYVSGGSSSGSAVAVAAGHVVFSLGTDTGGSGRIPAGFNGVVGIKPTVGLVSSRGLVPNCPTLDCPSVFCNSVSDGRKILDVISGYDQLDPYSRRPTTFPLAAPKQFRFGRLSTEQLRSFGMPECKILYQRACERLVQIGGEAVEIDFAPFVEAGELLFNGPWVAERRSAIGRLIDIKEGRLLDLTRQILRSAERFSAVDAFSAQHRLLQLRRQVQILYESMDALIVPTAPRPFTIAEMTANPIALNNQLGYYSYFANLLDLCGLAIPNGTLSNGMAMGATLLAPAWRDYVLLDIAGRLSPEDDQAPFRLRVYDQTRSQGRPAPC